MQPLRGALIGCGMASEFHLQAWKQLPEVEIAGLVDIDLDQAAARRDAFAPSTLLYRSIDELRCERLDFVDILTPPAVHAEQCRAALRAGLNVICQKPLADSLKSASELAAEFDASGKLLLVHENHRYRPWFQNVLERCRSGGLGKLVTVEVVDHHPVPAESYKLESHRGVWFEYGVHLVDMLLALLGPPANVSAKFSRGDLQVVGESAALVQLDFGEASAMIHLAWVQPKDCVGRMLIQGDLGSMEYQGPLTRGDRGELKTALSSGERSTEHVNPTAEYLESFVAAQRQFVECLKSGLRPSTTADHLRALAIVTAAYDASEGRGWRDIALHE